MLAKGEPESVEVPRTEPASPYRQGPGGLVEVLPDGSERAIEGFDDLVSVETVAPGDTWVMTRSGVYRTIRPPETFVRSGPSGPVHAWPPPADDDCAHPFVVLDAVPPAAVEALRKTDWPTESDVPLVSFEVHGLVVVGASVPTMADATRLADKLYPNGERLMEGGPHGIVCARPFGARPFALAPADARSPAP